MYPNFRLLFRLTYLSLFKSEGTHARLTGRRILVLLGFYTIFVPMQLINWIFFAVDLFAFGGYRRVRVREPVFIVGNPRTGSTRLMRVLARDEKTFACARLWELLLAPSITQRKIVKALAALDRGLGSPIHSRLLAWQERAFRKSDKYHKTRLNKPDEDELSLMPIFSAIHLAFPFPFLEEFTRYIYFDTQIPPAEKERFMAFYRLSMQRTLYLHGSSKHFLSKSPANSSRIETLCQTFPDAKFIYLTRDPTAVVPSTMSLFSFQWNTFCDLLDGHPFRESVLEMTKHWYRYPIRKLEERPEDSYAVVQYDDLVQNLGRTITDIYTDLEFHVNPQYAQMLREETAKARQYKSKHHYSLEEMGFTRQQITAEYQDVFDRFGFEAN